MQQTARGDHLGACSLHLRQTYGDRYAHFSDLAEVFAVYVADGQPAESSRNEDGDQSRAGSHSKRDAVNACRPLLSERRNRSGER